jgi:membrane-bound lytic murein transglycosylase MltF
LAWPVVLVLLLGCGAPPSVPVASAPATEQPAPAEPTPTAPAGDALLELASLESSLGLAENWTGDLDGMVERRAIRALVTYSKTSYFIDRGTQRGVTYEVLREFEKFTNETLGRDVVKVRLVILPVTRDELLPALTAGLGDIAAANLTITEEREHAVDFSIPFLTGVRELVVTGPSAPALTTLDDLAGTEIHVRRSSSYWESLVALNASFVARGLEPVTLIPAEEFLEDEDLLEMVNAGLIPIIVVDNHKAHFWDDVFDHIVVHEGLAVRVGGQIGWAMRMHNPQLAGLVNAFIKSHAQGTTFGNVILKRYYEGNPWVRNSLAAAERERFESMVHLFVKYGQQYGFEPLMLGALAYQESQLDQSLRSRRGAIGVMQMLPSTASDPAIGIPDITVLESNIHAGAKYLDLIRDSHFSDQAIDPLDQLLLTFAAYNAGPAKVHQLRAEAARQGLDPNRWFGHVETVAARRIGRETVQYVSNITKYFVAYRLAYDQMQKRGIDLTGR